MTMGKVGRPIGYVQSPETRAKISAALRARWAGPGREAFMAPARARRRPQIPPEDRPLFNKLVGYFRSSARAREELARLRNTP